MAENFSTMYECGFCHCFHWCNKDDYSLGNEGGGKESGREEYVGSWPTELCNCGSSNAIPLNDWAIQYYQANLYVCKWADKDTNVRSIFLKLARRFPVEVGLEHLNLWLDYADFFPMIPRNKTSLINTSKISNLKSNTMHSWKDLMNIANYCTL